MLTLPPSIFRAHGVRNPAQIFGADLEAWYDAAAGITEVATRITQWDDQSYHARNAAQASPNGPTYIAADVDGTPTVYFDPAEDSTSPARPQLTFSAGLVVQPEQTTYVFTEIPNTVKIKVAMNGQPAIAQFATHGFDGVTRQYPGITVNNVWTTPAQPVLTGWALLRFGGSFAGTLRSIATNADPQLTFAGSWTNASPAWTSMGAPANNRAIDGKVKQVIVVSAFIQDADPEHQQVLDYIKERYPTLVTY